MTARRLKHLLSWFIKEGHGECEVVNMQNGKHSPFDLVIVVKADNPGLGDSVLLLIEGSTIEVLPEPPEAPPG